jgi:hypothetical protein
MQTLAVASESSQWRRQCHSSVVRGRSKINRPIRFVECDSFAGCQRTQVPFKRWLRMVPFLLIQLF